MENQIRAKHTIRLTVCSNNVYQNLKVKKAKKDTQEGPADSERPA
jgi:hypothetical protein